MTSTEYYVGVAVFAVLWILTLITWWGTWEHDAPDYEYEGTDE